MSVYAKWSASLGERVRSAPDWAKHRGRRRPPVAAPHLVLPYGDVAATWAPDNGCYSTALTVSEVKSDGSLVAVPLGTPLKHGSYVATCRVVNTGALAAPSAIVELRVMRLEGPGALATTGDRWCGFVPVSLASGASADISLPFLAEHGARSVVVAKVRDPLLDPIPPGWDWTDRHVARRDPAPNYAGRWARADPMGGVWKVEQVGMKVTVSYVPGTSDPPWTADARWDGWAIVFDDPRQPGSTTFSGREPWGPAAEWLTVSTTTPSGDPVSYRLPAAP